MNKANLSKKVFIFVLSLLLIFQSLSIGNFLFGKANAQESSSSSAESTVTPSPSDSSTPAPTEEPSPSGTVSPTPTATPSEEPTPSPTPTGTPEVLTTPEPTPNESPIPPPSESPTPTPSVTTSSEEGVITAVLYTDKSDYAPTEVALIFGNNFTPGETYTLNITADNLDVNVSVTADSSGSFAYSYQLDGIYRPLYNVVAKDSSGVVIATTSFTDSYTGGGNIDVYSQCSNDDGDGYTGADPGCHWTNGNLNSANSTYHEDDATVQRLAIDDLTNGDHTVIIKYSTTKGGKHSYDFMTDDDFSELSPNPLTSADLCDPAITHLATCATLPPVLSDLIPTDSNADGHDVARSDRRFTIRNGTWVGTGILSGPTLLSGTYAGDSETIITLKFNVNTSACANGYTKQGTSVCEVLITWGAHVSTQADWGAGNSAVNISGSPYHVQIADVDGTSITGGGRDNQMAASAIIQTGTIIIHKNTVPDAAQDFGFTTTGGLTPSTFNLDDDADGTLPNTQTYTGVTSGTYSVTEGANSSYAVTISCTDPSGGTTTNNGTRTASIDLAPGETVECTYTNTRNTGTIIVKKVMVGGTDTFTYTGTPNGSISSNNGTIQATVDTGSYSSVEGAKTGWDLTSVVCDDQNSTGNVGTRTASFNVESGEIVTCTFTNTKRGHILIDKVTDPAGDPKSFDFTLTGGPSTLNQSFGLTDSDTPHDSGAILPGSGYNAAETVPDGWVKTGVTCNDGSPVTNIDVAPGETVTCTFNNAKKPHLTVNKIIIPPAYLAKDPGAFSLLIDGNVGVGVSIVTDQQTRTSISDLIDTTTPDGSTGQLTVDAGNHTISENGVGGTDVTKYNHEISCKDAQDNPVGVTPNATAFPWTVNLTNGQDVTCTIKNSTGSLLGFGSLTIVKTAVGGNDIFHYTASSTVPGTLIVPNSFFTSPFSIDSSTAVLPLFPAQHTLSISAAPGFPAIVHVGEDTPPAGWAFTSLGCISTGGKGSTFGYSGANATVTFQDEDDVTCTYTNNKPGAQIDVDPLSAFNKIGDNHKINAVVKVHNGDGVYIDAPDGTLVTFSLANNTALASFVDGINTCTTTAGTCSVTINSTSTGGVDIHASSDPVELGVTIHVETNGTDDNSADAHKTYENARISITPGEDTNEVDDDHDFLVTVEEDTGSGFVPVPEGTLANAIVNPSTSLDVSDCNDGVDVLGQCTVTINSSVAGVFTITARSTVVLNGVTFKLQTNGNGENSDPAVKTYVDANISLNPLDATNNVNAPHTVTVTVNKDPGTGLVAAAGEHVDFTLTDSGTTAVLNAASSTCDDAGPNTDINGQCVIVFTSATPGTVTIHATTTLTVGGVSLTRATDGTHGSTQDANKTYVAGKIIVQKQTDPTGSLTSFDFTPDYESAFSLTDGTQDESAFLAPGTYSVAETPISGWDLTSASCDDGSNPSSIDLSAGETVTCIFRNTEHGHIIVDKVTNPSGDTQSFDFTAGGTGYSNFSLTDVATPDDQEVSAGAYSVSEGAVAGWDSDGGSCDQGETPASLDVEPGETVTCTFTNTKKGSLTIVKDAQPNDCQNFNFSMTDQDNFSLDDDSGVADCQDSNQPQSKVVTDLIPGNYTASETLPNAFWQFGGVSCVNANQSTHAITPVTNGGTVTLEPGANVTCTFTNNKLGPTRTLGFWQTHTAYTTSVFNAAPLGGSMLIGNGGSHKGPVDTINKVFGAFYSSIPKKTDKSNRLPIDKARMQLLQQLVAAKLNCANFGCPASVQTIIATADTAYATGTAAQILASASALDAYNNSGDTITIGPAGSATPKTSQGLANLIFWNNP